MLKMGDRRKNLDFPQICAGDLRTRILWLVRCEKLQGVGAKKTKKTGIIPPLRIELYDSIAMKKGSMHECKVVTK
jgi:hypothetical protein